MISVMKSLTLLAVAALGTLLGGCFVSEQPNLPLSTAVAAFGEGGRYTIFERMEKDRFQRQEMFTVRHRSDGAYDFINEKGESLAISFHPIAADRFIGQTK